jgi:hypothetical protein
LVESGFPFTFKSKVIFKLPKQFIMRKYRSTCLLFISILFIVSCTKEGPEGPVGATGPQGATGSTGPAGAAGPQGAQGQTTVVYSAWVTSTAVNWVANNSSVTGAFDALAMYKRTAPSLTQAIIDNGAILCYMKGTAANASGLAPNIVVQLPYTYIDDDFEDHYDYTVPSPGNIYFTYKTGTSFAALDAAALGLFAYRYILIPGSVSGGRGINSVTTYEGYTAEQLRGMSYSQLAQIFNIPAEGSNIK